MLPTRDSLQGERHKQTESEGMAKDTHRLKYRPSSKIRKISNNNLTYHLKELEKEQTKSKVNSRKEIIKIRGLPWWRSG